MPTKTITFESLAESSDLFAAIEAAVVQYVDRTTATNVDVVDLATEVFNAVSGLADPVQTPTVSAHEIRPDDRFDYGGDRGL